VGETVVASQEGGFQRRDTLSCPGLEVYETEAPPRRSSDTRAFPLPSGQAEDGDAVESHNVVSTPLIAVPAGSKQSQWHIM
jgi:hypothetical protein